MVSASLQRASLPYYRFAFGIRRMVSASLQRALFFFIRSIRVIRMQKKSTDGFSTPHSRLGDTVVSVDFLMEKANVKT
jgi:hypothetical protein